MEGRTSPFNLLNGSWRVCKLAKFPILDGIGPENEMNNGLNIVWVSKFMERSNSIKNVYLQWLFYSIVYFLNMEDLVSSPFKLFMERSKVTKFDKFPIVGGIGPEIIYLKDKISSKCTLHVTNNDYLFYPIHSFALNFYISIDKSFYTIN